MKPHIIWPAASITELRNVIEESCEIVVTDAQAREVLDDPYLGPEILKWSASDTCTRGEIMSFLAKKIVGRSWPINGEGEAVYNAFIADFREKAVKLGYTFVDNGPEAA